MTGNDVLPEKDLSQKDAAIKRFEYSPLGSELKKQSDIAKDKYKILKDKQKLLLLKIQKR